MANKTLSESLMEEFCKIKEIRYERIVPDGGKMPDYIFFIDDRKIVVEVKQMDMNPEESKKINEFNRTGIVTIRTEPGKRVRGKITDSQRKFRKKTQTRNPSILVLYDNVKHYKHTEPFDILSGMYGQPYFSAEYLESNMNTSNMKHGPKQKMTKYFNTSISAIGVLEKDKDGNPTLILYYNRYAGVPLDPKLFAKFSVRQYEIEDIDSSIKWKEVSQGNRP